MNHVSKSKQDAAIRALLISETMTEAADRAGISRRTLFSYRHDESFLKELEKARNKMIRHTTDINFLIRAMQDESIPADLRMIATKRVTALLGRW